MNGATLTTDKERPAFSFDGKDDYMKLPYHVGDMEQMTFTAWVKTSSTSASAMARMNTYSSPPLTAATCDLR